MAIGKQPATALSFSSSCVMSLCLNRSRRAFDASRTPSMIEAWLSSSETIAEPSSQIVGKRPVFAFQQETYESAASVPKNSAMRSSRTRWMSNVPQMKRTEAVPAPYLSRPRLPASTTSGIVGEAEVVVARQNDDVAGLFHVDLRRHRRREVAEMLVGAGLFERVEVALQLLFEGLIHDFAMSPLKSSTILTASPFFIKSKARSNSA